MNVFTIRIGDVATVNNIQPTGGAAAEQFQGRESDHRSGNCATVQLLTTSSHQKKTPQVQQQINLM